MSKEKSGGKSSSTKITENTQKESYNLPVTPQDYIKPQEVKPPQKDKSK